MTKIHRGKRSLSDRIFRIVGFIFMTFFALSFIFAFLWLFLSSFRTPASFRMNSFDMFGFKDYTIDNYVKVFSVKVDTTKRSIGMFGMIGNTLIVTSGSILLSVTVPAVTGYIVAKYNFFIKRVLDILAIGTMVIPTVGSTVIIYKLIDTLGIMDTYWAIFIQSAGGLGFSYMIFRNYYSAIPIDYAEAAYLDGASDLQIFIKIMYPQSIPLVVSTAVMTFIGSWNDYYTPYMYMEGNPTVAVGLNLVYQKFAVVKNNYPTAFAAMSLSAIISLIIYACFSKTIMESMSVGGLKG